MGYHTFVSHQLYLRLVQVKAFWNSLANKDHNTWWRRTALLDCSKKMATKRRFMIKWTNRFAQCQQWLNQTRWYPPLHLWKHLCKNLGWCRKAAQAPSHYKLMCLIETRSRCGEFLVDGTCLAGPCFNECATILRIAFHEFVKAPVGFDGCWWMLMNEVDECLVGGVHKKIFVGKTDTTPEALFCVYSKLSAHRTGCSSRTSLSWTCNSTTGRWWWGENPR